MSFLPLPRLLTAAGVTGASAALLLGVPAAASADSGSATDHFVTNQTDYFPRPGDDASTFYGIFSLDGACGFPSARFSSSDTETFFVAQHHNAVTDYKYNSVGKISGEAWTFTPVGADGVALPSFSGTANEVATAVGVDNGATPLSVNYTFDGTASGSGGTGCTWS